MNKSELIAAIAGKTGLTKKDSEQAVNVLIEEIAGALKKGDKVSVAGFGTFEVKHRAARMGRNPKTKEPIQIAASKAPAFKPGKQFKDAI